ncbi:MAG: hypothetical protein HWE07_02765 [Cytophagia bacterium]|nr:hypothetical protein [Cytophagia bacterium]
MKFIGNINLTNKDDYQAIYASQLYGTFFMVFAKFTCEYSSEKKAYIMQKIDFRLVNYKGLINIGIKSVQGIEKRVDLKNNQYNLVRLELQGLKTDSKDKSLPCSGFELKQGDCLVIDRTTVKMHNGTALNQNVFDEEFYYRHGIEPNDNYRERSPGPDADGDINIKGPDSICPRAMNFVA